MVEEVESYGFYFNHEKRETFSGKGVFFWGGLRIDPKKEAISTPYRYTSDIPSVFRGKTHWERKQNSNTLSLGPTSGYSRLAYVYERTFGYEFFAGESLLNPLNGGVNPRAPMKRGWIQTAHVERFRSLGQRNIELMRYEMPISIVKKHANSMAFAKKRKQMFRRPIKSTYTSDYLYPRIEKGKWQKTQVSPLGQTIPPWMEKRMMLYNNILSEKFTKGLNYQHMLDAALEFCYSEDPFDLKSRLNSRYTTEYHRPHVLSEEWEDLIDRIIKMKKISDYATLRADLMSPPEREMHIINQANILHKRRANPEFKDRINRIVFGDRVRESLDILKRKREDITDPEEEDDEKDPSRTRARFGTEPPEEEGSVFQEEIFYSQNGEEVSPIEFFIEEEPDRCLELVFAEDEFYPSLP